MYDEDRNEYECYIKGTMELLTCKEYSASELKILLRLSAFRTVFFEGAEKTAKILNLSLKTVQAAKRRFEELGILEEIEDHGHGKRYKVHKDLIDHPSEIFGDKSERQIEELSEQEPAEKEPRDPKKYGAEDINDYLETWKEETGFDFLEDKQQRKCARLVLNKYGMDEAVKIARRVGRAQTDRYAPRITSPNDIVGRYSKLPALEVYEKRRDAEQNQPKSTAPKPSKLAQMHYTAPDFRWADYTAENNESDETKAAAIKKARQIFEARSYHKPTTKPEAKK